MKKIYHNEIACQSHYKNKTKCRNNAYYVQKQKYVCGVHSQKNNRKKLDVNPQAKQNRMKKLKNHSVLVEKCAEENKKNKKIGKVIITKLRMMKSAEQHDGYRKVFPNFRHANRADGFGCATLSPKSIGPIPHKMLDFGWAKTLENYHQGAKVFKGELCNDVNENTPVIHFDKCDTRMITHESVTLRKEMYNDKTPYRHKFQYPGFPVDEKKIKGNKNIPLFTVYYEEDGTEHRYNYLQCRFFYCHWYALFVVNKPEFKKMKDMMLNGYNLQIVGYDGYAIEKSLWECYNDISRPFGHEQVLYTLLTCDESGYPWDRYYDENENIYKNVLTK